MTTPYELGKAFRLGNAFKLGMAFRLGMAFSVGARHGRSLALDDRWITIHPNGKYNAKGDKNKGQPIRLNDDGIVVGGAGGVLNGQRFSKKSKSNPIKTPPTKAKPISQPATPKAEVKPEPPKPLPSYSKALGENSYKELRSSIEKGDKISLNIFNKFENHIAFDSLNARGTAYYYSGTKGITMNLSKVRFGTRFSTPWQSFFHEVGHAIDDKCGDGELYATSIHLEFAKAIQKDVDAYVKKVFEKLKKKAKGNPEFQERLGFTSARGNVPIRYAYSRVARDLDSYTANHPTIGPVISDIFNGATKGKIYTQCRHPTSYWQKMPIRVAREGFAHLFSLAIQRPDKLSEVEKYLPTAVPEFKKLLATMNERFA